MTAFNIRELSVLAYANGFTLWHYRHGGPLDDIAHDQSFFGQGDDFRHGDMVVVNTTDGAAIVVVTVEGETVRHAQVGTPHSRRPAIALGGRVMPKWVVISRRAEDHPTAQIVEADNAAAAVRKAIGKPLDLEVAEGDLPSAQWKVNRIETCVSTFSVREKW